MNELVSIIIPCLNCSRTVTAALTSCANQTYSPVEVLFVDNGSNDESLALARQLGNELSLDVKTLRCDEPGANRARLQGLRQVSGDYVLFLDADDELAPRKLELQVRALQNSPDFDVSYGDWIWRCQLEAFPDLPPTAKALNSIFFGTAHAAARWKASEASKQIAEWSFNLKQENDYLLRLLECKWAPPHSFLWRRGLIEMLLKEQAIWPERKVEQDREWVLFAAVLGAKFLHSSGASVIYNVHSTGQVSQSAGLDTRRRANRDIFQRLRDVAERKGIELSSEHRRLLEQPWDWFVASRALRDKPLPKETYRDEKQWARYLARKAVRNASEAFVLEDFALKVAFHEPSMWGRHSLLMEALLGMRKRGELQSLSDEDALPGA